MSVTARKQIEPYKIEIPDPITTDIDELVEDVAKRLGEAPRNVRRGVEIAILSRGIAAVRSEEGKR